MAGTDHFGAGLGEWMVARRTALLTVALVALVGHGPAKADEYTIQPQLQFSAFANDNIRLSTEDEEEVAGGILSPQMTFGYRSPSTDVTLTGRTDLNGYAVNSDLSSVDNRVDFHSGFQSERGYLSLDADYNRDTIFETVDDNDVEFFDKQRVTTVTVTPSYSYDLTPIDRIRLNGGFVNRNYGGDPDRLVDYRFYTAGTDWSHDVTEIDTFIAGVGYGHFDPVESDNASSDIVDLQLGWARDFSERFRVRVVGGPSWISDRGEEDIGYNADARITYDYDERTTFSAVYTLRSEPSSGGRITENRSRFAASAEHQLTELLTVRFDGSYVGKETGSTGDTSSFSLQPSLVWQVAEEVDVTASYRFRHKSREDPDEEASSNSVLITLTYRPTRWTWSD